jgi:hypothetical protein
MEQLELAPALEIWRRILSEILDNAQVENSAQIIPEKIHPYLQTLHTKLSNCKCKLGSCKECVESRKVLAFTWDKMDHGF